MYYMQKVQKNECINTTSGTFSYYIKNSSKNKIKCLNGSKTKIMNYLYIITLRQVITRSISLICNLWFNRISENHEGTAGN